MLPVFELAGASFSASSPRTAFACSSAFSDVRPCRRRPGVPCSSPPPPLLSLFAPEAARRPRPTPRAAAAAAVVAMAAAAAASVTSGAWEGRSLSSSRFRWRSDDACYFFAPSPFLGILHLPPADCERK